VANSPHYSQGCSPDYSGPPAISNQTSAATHLPGDPSALSGGPIASAATGSVTARQPLTVLRPHRLWAATCTEDLDAPEVVSIRVEIPTDLDEFGALDDVAPAVESSVS